MTKLILMIIIMRADFSDITEQLHHLEFFNWRHFQRISSKTCNGQIVFGTNRSSN